MSKEAEAIAQEKFCFYWRDRKTIAELKSIYIEGYDKGFEEGRKDWFIDCLKNVQPSDELIKRCKDAIKQLTPRFSDHDDILAITSLMFVAMAWELKSHKAQFDAGREEGRREVLDNIFLAAKKRIFEGDLRNSDYLTWREFNEIIDQLRTEVKG